MKPNDETLMAYADGELPLEQRTQLEASLATDESLRLRVATLRTQRGQLVAAFNSVLDEPVPDRLTRLLKTSPPVAIEQAPSKVVALADVRAQRDAKRQMPSWAQWGGMAASLVLGAVLGLQWHADSTDQAMALSKGQLVAAGSISKALSSQLASEPQQGAAVAVQLSFVDTSGSYCRTFSTGAVAGLACQHDGQWALTTVSTMRTATTPNATAAGDMRPAATALPQAILDAVDQRIAGTALDGTAERSARDHAWHH